MSGARPAAELAAVVDRLRALRALGWVYTEIATELGMTKGVVVGIAHRAKIPAPDPIVVAARRPTPAPKPAPAPRPKRRASSKRLVPPSPVQTRSHKRTISSRLLICNRQPLPAGHPLTAGVIGLTPWVSL